MMNNFKKLISLSIFSTLPLIGHANTSLTNTDVYSYIVKYKELDSNKRSTFNSQSSDKKIQALSVRHGIKGQHIRSISPDIQLVSAEGSQDEILKKLSQDKDIEYVSVNHRRRISITEPNDTEFNNFAMWGLWDPSYSQDFYSWNTNGKLSLNKDGKPEAFSGAANFESAWDITTGNSSIVVAVLDGGVLLNHADLFDKLLPGYDFIFDAETSLDGDGRDDDPSDPGDCFLGTTSCFESSWHGTHVAGTIAASSNNNLGITGSGWNTSILPVRVLGYDGGYDSDIIDGMRWAAGLSVPGVPNNPNPAKVINLSLGGESVCSAAWQDVINDVVSQGVTIVVAAGNENIAVADSSPANCNNVIAVTAVDFGGDRAEYANYDDRTNIIDIAAPGGDLIGILSTGDTGQFTPNNDNAYIPNVGTSMAAPHVSGAIALILDINKYLTPESIEKIIKQSARSNFVTETSLWSASDLSVRECKVSRINIAYGCGSGYLDAFEALKLAADAPKINSTLAAMTTDDITPVTTQINAVGQLNSAMGYQVISNDNRLGSASVSNTGLLTYTPKFGAEGKDVVHYSVTENGFEIRSSVEVNVETSGLSITFQNSQSQYELILGHTLNFSVDASASNGDTISYSVDPTPFGIATIDSESGEFEFISPNNNSYIGDNLSININATSTFATVTKTYQVSLIGLERADPERFASSSSAGSLHISLLLLMIMSAVYRTRRIKI
jgi:hypothetical protein